MFEIPLDLQIKKNFIRFLEKRGLIYDSSDSDYIIKVYIFSEPPEYIQKLETILGPAGVIGLALVGTGLITFIKSAVLGPEGGVSRGMSMWMIGTVLALPYLILMDVQLFTHYDFKGILHSETIVIKNGKLVLRKEYPISVYKKEPSKNISNPNFISGHLCEILEKSLINFEKDMYSIFQ